MEFASWTTESATLWDFMFMLNPESFALNFMNFMRSFLVLVVKFVLSTIIFGWPFSAFLQKGKIVKLKKRITVLYMNIFIIPCN